MLITLSRTVFRGEGEREVGFRSALRDQGRAIVEVSDSDGIDATNERLVLEALERIPRWKRCTPSAAGTPRPSRRSRGSAGSAGCSWPTISTPTTGRLLREGRISAVLHNDLRADARLALRLILQQRGALPAEPARPVPIQVITPYNVPPRPRAS